MRSLSGAPEIRVAFECAWGSIRAIQLHAEPSEVPEGLVLGHVVTLNLGRETASELSIAGGRWTPHRTPHHAVGVYPALVPHALRERDARELLLLEIDPAFVATALGPTAGELRPVVGMLDGFVKHVMLALAEEARSKAPAGTLRAECLATALVSQLFERGNSAPPPLVVAALSSQKLRRVLDYVAARLDAPMTLDTLAGLVEMDVFRFIRAFKQSTGTSPHQYVLEARINRAKELLRDRQLSIGEIALETGFATQSHFSVTFRRLVGMTPRTYRDSPP